MSQILSKLLPKISILCIWAILMFSGARILAKSSYFSSEKNTIHIFTWPEQFLLETIKEFENKTNIKVIVHNFSSNEELIAKMNKTKGNGYDIVVPSDYAVKMLIDNNFLKKIDKSKINFFESLDPFLLNRQYDPNNDYSIPHTWEVFGFGIDKELLKTIIPSWDMLFKPSLSDYKVAMSNDPIEAICFASFFLYGNKNTLNTQEKSDLASLLIQQKKWVEAYSVIRADYLLVTKNCQVALSPSSFILRAMEKNPNIDFVLPKEGTFISIENACISKESIKDDLIYQFLNFVYQKNKMRKVSCRFLCFPPRLDALEDSEVALDYARILEETRKDRNKARTIDFKMPEHQARQLWVKVKSS